MQIRIQPNSSSRKVDTRNGHWDGIQNPDGQNSDFFSNEPPENRPVITVQDSDFQTDDHLEAHLFRNGLYLNTHP